MTLRLTFVDLRPDLEAEHNRWRAFVDEVGARAGASVLQVATLRDAPGEGFVLVSTRDPEAELSAIDFDQRSEFASRLVPLGLDEQGIPTLRMLESLGSPAAIFRSPWHAAAQLKLGSFGLYGLTRLGDEIGATSSERSVTHGLLQRKGDSLAVLLADYLTALGSP